MPWKGATVAQFVNDALGRSLLKERDTSRKRIAQLEKRIERLRGLLPFIAKLKRLLGHWKVPDMPQQYKVVLEQLIEAAEAAGERRNADRP